MDAVLEGALIGASVAVGVFLLGILGLFLIFLRHLRPLGWVLLLGVMAWVLLR